MSDRNRRESARRRDFMEWQHSRERGYGNDQPWREERRDRYPDEPYGGDRDERWSQPRQSHRGRRDEGMRGWDDEHRGGADYRGDFGAEGREYFRREQRSGRGWDNYAREGDRARGDVRDAPRTTGRERGGFGASIDRWNTGGSFGFGPAEGVDDREDYAYGSPYGQGDLNSDRPGRGGWRDTDWSPNRPARGRGTWAGDWETGGRSEMGRGYRGRGPKDYRRSDERIREELSDLFTDDPDLDASDISIKVENGDVLLMGSVPTRQQKRHAEDLSERISGVRDVINQLRVSRGDMTSGTTSGAGREKTARGGATSPQQDVAADRSDRNP